MTAALISCYSGIRTAKADDRILRKNIYRQVIHEVNGDGIAEVKWITTCYNITTYPVSNGWRKGAACWSNRYGITSVLAAQVAFIKRIGRHRIPVNRSINQS